MREGRGYGVLATFALAALTLLLVFAVQIGSVLASSIYGAARTDARENARLIADLGLASALADGRLTDADRRAAVDEFHAAARTHPLTGVTTWARSGTPVFAAGRDARIPDHPVPAIVRRAFLSGAAETGYTRDPRVGNLIEAAVPLRTVHGTFVADFHFSRGAVERDVAGAQRRLLVLGMVAALCFLVAIVPPLARLFRRLPPPIHRRHRAVLAELRRALRDDELRVHYQPQIDIVSGAVVGVEALVRWQHPRRGLLGPAEFLAEAERCPALLAAMTDRVLDCAVGDCARWAREGRALTVAVNIAAATLVEEPIVPMVVAALSRHRLEPALLTLEVTETAIAQGAGAIDVVAQLRDLGIGVSIDDFGTGYSSLSRLRSLPLDELKIDRAFVRGISADSRDLAVVQLIADLGRSFGLKVVAEGVEDEETLTRLRGAGCAIAQGYLFSRPLPEPDLLAWIDARAGRALARPAGAFERDLTRPDGEGDGVGAVARAQAAQRVA